VIPSGALLGEEAGVDRSGVAETVSPVATRLFAGAALLALAGIAGRLASLPASPYLTARIGPEGYGVAALVATCVSLGAAVALVGLDVSYVRHVGTGDVDGAPEGRFCWRAATLTALAAGLVGGVAFAVLARVPHAAGLAAMVGLGVVLSALGAMASARRRLLGRYRSLAAATLLGALVGTATNVGVAAWVRQDAWALVLGATAGAAVALAANGLPLGALRARSGLSPARRWQVASLGLASTVTAPGYWIMTSSDRWILAAWWNDSVVGVYSFASQFGLLAQFVPVAVGAVWLPEVMRLEGRGSRARPAIGRLWEAVALVYMAAWVAVSLAGGDLLRLLSAPSFHEGAGVIPLVAGAVVLNGFFQLGVQSHTMAHRLARTLGPVALAVAVSLALNLVSIPWLGAAGAAWTQALSFFLLAVVVVWRGQQVYPIDVRWLRVGALAVLSMTVVLAGHRPLAASPIASLALKMVPACLYGLVAAAIAGRDTVRPVLALARVGG
jgi:O-antigen/teichoic acid export membrane protein